MFLEIAILFGANLLSAAFIFHFLKQSTEKMAWVVESHIEIMTLLEDFFHVVVQP